MARTRREDRPRGSSKPVASRKSKVEEVQDVVITFQHSVDMKKVMMAFDTSVDRLVFNAEDAEQVAEQLLKNAFYARGGASKGQAS